jgi:hypothetical protein
MDETANHKDYRDTKLLESQQGRGIWYCGSKTCGKVLQQGDIIFIDRMSEAIYCEKCGTCLRYHRKKAIERGEELPLNFESVDKRINGK